MIARRLERSARPHSGARARMREGGAARALARARRHPGQALPEELRDALSARLGVRLGDVRVHRDAEAARAAEALGANALTVGQHIFFGQGRYDPWSLDGGGLLAHEAAHTVAQQGAAEPPSLEVSSPGDSGERAAERLAAGQGGPAPRLPVERVQRDVLGTTLHLARENANPENALHFADPLYQGFRRMVTLSILSSRGLVAPPARWLGVVARYAASAPADGFFLAHALAHLPTFHRGGLILDLQPGATAMTLDHDVFVRGALSLKTFVHELVHVSQYAALGIDAFLVSYFGMSGLTIAYRWAAGSPLNPMRSSPHEAQAYGLAARFDTWYTAHYGSSASSVTI